MRILPLSVLGFLLIVLIVFSVRAEESRPPRTQAPGPGPPLETAPTPLDRAAVRAVEAALSALAEAFDATRGGFGPGPKALPHGALRLLLIEHRRTANAQALHMADRMLEVMARSGLHDHLGGGFYRASRDEHWTVPQFEKHLAHNALLLRAYAQGHRATGKRFYRHVAEETVAWAIREMRDATGVFWASMHATEDGRFYLWTHEEIRQVLGRERGEEFLRVYRLAPPGVLLLEGSPYAGLDASRELLRRRRNRRVRPAVDETVLTGANGLMIGALANSGSLLSRGADLEVARRAATAIQERLGPPAVLKRSIQGGVVGGPAELDDYAFLAEGLLDLHEATGEARWREEARALTDVAVARFWDGTTGGFFQTAGRDRRRMERGKEARDTELPAASVVMASVLRRLGTLTGEARYSALARRTIEAFLAELERSPRGMETLAAAMAEWLGTAPQPR